MIKIMFSQIHHHTDNTYASECEAAQSTQATFSHYFSRK